ncbi:unnamed protein product [Chrysoparadoxa australica]
MASHGSPPEGMTCSCCWEDVDMDLYVEYTAEEGGDWLPSQFCLTCVESLLNSQWKMYVEGLAKATCKAEQKRLLDRGPPINLRDKTALPCPDDGEVHELWYGKDGQSHSAKLLGSLQGDERQRWWDEKLAFKFDEPDEEDEQAR